MTFDVPFDNMIYHDSMTVKMRTVQGFHMCFTIVAVSQMQESIDRCCGQST